MCTTVSLRISGLLLGAVLTACGSDLTLPEDGTPIDDRSPAQLLAVSGDSQAARVGKRLDKPLVVLVTDASARPVVGAQVEFRFQETVPDAEVDPTAASTGANGRASAEVRLGSIAGLHIVEARVAEATTSSLRTTFGVMAVPKGGGGGDDDDDDDD
jgi:hypothetical protein